MNSDINSTPDLSNFPVYRGKGGFRRASPARDWHGKAGSCLSFLKFSSKLKQQDFSLILNEFQYRSQLGSLTFPGVPGQGRLQPARAPAKLIQARTTHAVPKHNNAAARLSANTPTFFDPCEKSGVPVPRGTGTRRQGAVYRFLKFHPK